MNILAANDIKRHGVIIIEKKLKKGPVHILKHNKPLFVVLTEENYQSLVSKNLTPTSALFSMLTKPPTGKRSRREIDKQIKQERDSWN